MTSELLKKENEFYKENEKLELKTKELISKVNNVMKIQENLISDTFITKLYTENVKSCNNQRLLNSNNSTLTEKELAELNLPSNVNDVGSKGLSVIFRTKLKTLNADYQRLESDFKKKSEEVKQLQKEKAHLSEEKEKWFTSYTSCKNSLAKIENQNTILTSKNQTKECENISLKKEVDRLKKELNFTNLNVNNHEVRLNRLHEENDKLKETLKNTKELDRESKESFKKERKEFLDTIKKLEKHKTELLNAFKKQLCLIHNLKRQKIHLSSIKAAELCETDFLKLLDHKFD